MVKARANVKAVDSSWAIVTLTAMRDRLRVDIDSYRTLLRVPVEKSPELAEHSVIFEGREQIHSNIKSKTVELERVISALERANSGTWGICRGCGVPIDQTRLRAVPTALRCIDCEEKREISSAPEKLSHGKGRTYGTTAEYRA